MDGDAAADRQRDEQWEGSPDDAARAHVDAALKDTHTCLPGIVKSFDAATQTATVQPAIRRLFIPDGFVDLPACVDVPVQFPRGGGFVLTFPVAAGDECLLVFSERAIDFWWDRGGVQEPAEVRFHDLSDAFAIMGVSSKPKMISGLATNAAELRTLDGTTVLRLEPTGILVGGVGALPTVNNAYRAADVTKNTALAAALAALATASTGPLAPLAAQFTAAATALTTFEAGAAGYLTTKAKVL